MSATRRRSRRLLRFVDPFFVAVPVAVMVGLFALAAQRLVDRYVRQVHVVVGAGGEDGESYAIARALEKVLEADHPNLGIEVWATEGTSANLAALESRAVELAVAQADVALDRWTNPRTAATQDPNLGAVLAILYVDKAQLLVCPEAAEGPVPSIREVVDRWKAPGPPVTVRLPYENEGPTGGQVVTFRRLAGHFGLEEGRHYTCIDDQDEAPPSCDGTRAREAIFRVRADGNTGVQAAVDRGWRLVDLVEVDAMRLANAALQPATLAEGTYHRPAEGAPIPEPPRPVTTFAVRRLLLARADGSVPSWVVDRIVRTLDERGPLLARSAAGETAFESEVQRLLLQLPSLNIPDTLRQIGVPLHPDAVVVYEPDRSWFAQLNANAEGLALAITVIGFLFSGGIAVRRTFGFIRKSYADDLMMRATRLMTQPLRPLDAPPDAEVSLQEAREGFRAKALDERVQVHIDRLIDDLIRMTRLEAVFAEAGRSLAAEEISEESFRTFNEAFKAAREAIERAIEGERREISLAFVSQLLDGFIEDPAAWSEEAALTVLRSAREILGHDLVFSRDSFRTFIEAFQLVRSQSAAR